MRNLLFLLAALFAFPACAQDEKPSELSPLIKAEKPYGVAKLSKLFLSVYDGQVWTDAPQWSMDVPYALTLHYHMNFSPEELSDRSLEEIGRSVKLSAEETQSYGKQLRAIFPQVHPDDRITAFFQPARGVSFFYNGKPAGKISDKIFAARFMGIWLSEKTSEPEFRQALLEKGGQGSVQ